MISNWNDLPLGIYLDILKVANNESEDIDKQVQYIALLSGMDENAVLNMPIAEYADCAEKTKFLLKEADKVKGRITDRYVLNGTKYKLTTDYRQITAAQYIDFQTYCKNATDHIVELISIFLIPEGKKYNDGYDVLSVQSDIRQCLSVPMANALVAFFLSRLRISIKATLISLAWMSKWNRARRKKLRKVRKQIKTVFNKSGDGLHR